MKERQFVLAVNNVMLYNSFLIHPLKDNCFNVNSAPKQYKQFWDGPAKTQQHHVDPKGCIRNKKQLNFLCCVLIRPWLVCSMLLLLSLLIHVAKPTSKLRLFFFSHSIELLSKEVFYFIGILIFKVINKSQRNQKRTIGPMPYTLCGLKKLFDDCKFPSQKHSQTNLKFQKCFLGQNCSKFSLVDLIQDEGQTELRSIWYLNEDIRKFKKCEMQLDVSFIL